MLRCVVLGLLRNPAGASSLATGNLLAAESIPINGFGLWKLRSAIEVTQIDIQAPEAVQQRAPWQAEFAGGEGLVAVVLAQAIEQQAALDLLQALAQVETGV